MQDDTQGDETPPRRVVRRVVRRTVVAPPPPTVSRVRPSEPEPPSSEPSRDPDPERPTRAGGRRRERAPLRERLAGLLPSRPAPAEAPTPAPAEEAPPETQPEPERAEPREPVRERLAGATAGLRERASVLLGRAADLPRPAYAALVGLAVGVGAVLVCWVAILVFSALRGTPAGGGWGFAVLVLVGVGAVVAGSRLLSLAGVPEPGGTSLIAVLLVPVIVLALFLGLSTTGWAVVIVPLLGAATFAAVQPVTERLSDRPGSTA